MTADQVAYERSDKYGQNQDLNKAAAQPIPTQIARPAAMAVAPMCPAAAKNDGYTTRKLDKF